MAEDANLDELTISLIESDVEEVEFVHNANNSFTLKFETSNLDVGKYKSKILLDDGIALNEGELEVKVT